MKRGRRVKRKGSIVVLIALLMPVLVGMGAFAIDVGYITYMRSQTQAGADAGALAALEELPGDQAALESVASRYASLNCPSVTNLQVTAEAGTWNDTLTPADSADANAVRVDVLRPNASLFLGRFLGRGHADISVSATAIYEDRISGFEVLEGGPNCSLMPFAVERDRWIDEIVNGHGNDAWTYEKDNRWVGNGGDGIHEMNLYPTKGITPGNYGTVDIGNHNNATPDLERQIRYGPNAADLASYGGKLELDAETQVLNLNGDTGISAGIKDAMEDVVALPRTIMLYDQVTGNGNNAYYRIVGFVGITVLEVDLTGSNSHVTIQPAYVEDPTVIAGESRGENYYVRYPPQLVR